MLGTKRLVCLANSRKLHGRCVAGREWNGREAGSWIRLVSEWEAEAVSKNERQYLSGNQPEYKYWSDPKVLDIIDVPVLESTPEGYQTENWLLVPGVRWRKVGRLSPSHLSVLTDPVASLWIDGYHTFQGFNDKIPIARVRSVTASLRLLYADRLRLTVCTPGEVFGDNKRRVQGGFQHAGRKYAMWVTDPGFERTYLARPNGTYEISDCYLTISLGEAYRNASYNACYKLIAAIIPAT